MTATNLSERSTDPMMAQLISSKAMLLCDFLLIQLLVVLLAITVVVSLLLPDLTRAKETRITLL